MDEKEAYIALNTAEQNVCKSCICKNMLVREKNE